MRLHELHVVEFKNLRDFHIDFDAGSPYTVLVGGNGAGKSNLMEALALIFRGIDLGGTAPFDYRLRYECRGHEIEVTGRADKGVAARTRAAGSSDALVKLAKRDFLGDPDERQPEYRPAFVFGYYSGPSDRLSSLFEPHRNRYYNWIIQPPERRKKHLEDPNVLRRLFYAETLHGQFALIAFFMDSDERQDADREFLREHLFIEELDSVLFALKRPHWGGRPGGDERFWGAKGEVQMFLDRLYDKALAPARMDRRMPTGIGTETNVENLYLFLADQPSLQAVYDSYGDQYQFFTALESTHLSQLLAEVRTRVRMSPRAGGGQHTYRDLSEGEQQLLLVLGLLKFTARDEALFLLDEPDTHLNPAWSAQYLDFLGHFTGERENSHIVMTTHDPLVFARLRRDQVRIISRDAEGVAFADTPVDDPIGMGIQAILASDLFRLPSGGLDPGTLGDLERQRELAHDIESRTAEEQEELGEITARLEQRGFWNNRRDPIEQLFRTEFIPRWLDRVQPGETEQPSLTVEETRRREAIAAEIAAELAEELTTGQLRLEEPAG